MDPLTEDGRRRGRALWGTFLVAFLVAGGALFPAEGAGPGKALDPGEVIPVGQPLFGTSFFYVHRPSSLPEGWFATLEGYPVRPLSEGEWVFGFLTPGGWRSTGCMVGTLDPAAVGILPAVPPRSLPPGLPPLPGGACLGMGALTLSSGEGGVSPWASDPLFQEVKTWRATVDRMAVLVKVPVVLAWKGDHPEVVHAWTGQDWLSLYPRPGEDLDHLLARHLYTLVQLLHRGGFVWTPGDTALLASQCTSWGYLWSGVLALEMR